MKTKPQDIWKNFPQKKINGSVKRLEKICIENICDSIDHWMKYLPDDAHLCKYVASPFNCLSSHDTLRILEILLKKKTFNVQHLNLILHDKLTSMDFDAILNESTIEKKALQIYFKIMFRRCKRIKQLKIQNFCVTKVICRRISTYRNLEVLYLERPNNELISKISKYCWRLKSLHLSWDNETLTDISSLVNLTELQSLSIKTGRCQFIPDLPVMLNIFPKLKVLILDNCTFRGAQITESMGAFTRLTKLHFSNFCEVPHTDLLTILRECLANVTDLKLPPIEREDMTCSEILNCIANLRHLEKLDLSRTYYQWTRIFDTCFMKIGPQLRLLNLSSCSSVNLWLVRKHCQNLEELYSLSTAYIIPDKRDRPQSVKQYFCPKLKVLHIELFASRRVTHNLASDVDVQDALKEMMFLDSPVSNLRLRECNQTFFESILNEMETEHLERLEIVRCMFITFDHVVNILLKFNNLKYFAIHYCFSFTKDEKSRIENFVEQSKIDLEIDILK